MAAAAGDARWPDVQSFRQRIGRRERQVQALLYAAALLTVLITLGIVAVLVDGAAGFFREVPLARFLGETRWTPLFPDEQHFGIWPLVAGTLLTTVGACVIALPMGLGAAVYLSEYASNRLRRLLKPVLEILWGIPTVVYGYFALTVVTPLLRHIDPDINIFNAASAALVMGIMILPMVASLSEDALLAVPKSLRDAAYALGATRFEVVTRVVIPAALPGIVASFVLAISRAVGETMIVAMAAGSTPKLTFNIFDSIQTMTAYIVQVSLGDAAHGTIEYYTLFAVALVLFLITLSLNVVARRIARRYTEG